MPNCQFVSIVEFSQKLHFSNTFCHHVWNKIWTLKRMKLVYDGNKKPQSTYSIWGKLKSFAYTNWTAKPTKERTTFERRIILHWFDVVVVVVCFFLVFICYIVAFFRRVPNLNATYIVVVLLVWVSRCVLSWAASVVEHGMHSNGIIKISTCENGIDRDRRQNGNTKNENQDTNVSHNPKITTEQQALCTPTDVSIF